MFVSQFTVSFANSPFTSVDTTITRSSHRRCSLRNFRNFLRNVLRHFTKFTGKHLCHSLFFPESCNFIKKDTLTQLFFYEFCEISENIFFTEHLRRLLLYNQKQSSRGVVQNRYSWKFCKIHKKTAVLKTHF